MPGDAAPFEPEHFRRVDETGDARFYAVPRLVTHIDDGAITALTAFYRRALLEGGDVLDLMSSWVSHLPDEVTYGRVAGLGMNAAELDRNPRLTQRLVHDLNTDPVLPFDDAAFDAVTIAVSVQYLTRPVEVFAEIARVLRPNGAVVVSFSNRCFPTKAVAVWQVLDDRGHAELVGAYLGLAGGFGPAHAVDLRPDRGPGEDPMYAVVAHRLAAAGEEEP